MSPRERFVARYGGVYEHSPWIAEAAFDAGPPRETAAALRAAMAAVVEAADETAKLELLRAHPDLAGRLAVAGALTAASSAEQASAGLDACSDAEFARFTELNAAYNARFGFPFILAVRGRDRAAILANFEARVANSPRVEFAEALAQVHEIARLRLEAMFD